MGFFDFFDLAPKASPTPNVHSLLPPPTTKQPELDVSFDLTLAHPSQRTPLNCTHAPVRSSSHYPLPVIPLELVISILECAYYDNDHNTVNTNFLRTCSLVCRSWRLPSQKLLFTDVTLRTQTAYGSFRKAVNRNSATGRILGDSVLRLHVTIDHNQPYSLSQRSFAHAVTLCPNLYELSLALYGSNPSSAFDETTLDLLHSGPRITALHFSNWSNDQDCVYSLLGEWSTTLKSLSLSGTPPSPLVHPSVDSTITPLRCSLEELRMNFQVEPSLGFMKWLLDNSINTLRIVELERDPSVAFLEYLVETHAETLHSLALPNPPNCSTTGNSPAAEYSHILERCRNLREVRLERCGQAGLKEVIRVMSDDVEHLAVGIDADSSLQPILEAVKSRDKLKTVTLHLWEGANRHIYAGQRYIHGQGQLAPLKMACAFRGVELRVTSDIRVFRTLVRGDFVPPSMMVFPRVKSIDNLRYMRLRS
ncbi:hypothetical protein BDN72DRAFT_769529 [Pluteus cervinus]|uniref:Uncharacterized protein n=1 Tax=Pluteus cervinus TaxID=181527 RepID=A0ACD3AR99_9AGAR|nr:hypothetical protein BDN72DRAFT_769529 [Pluteus cervinus]